MNGRLRLMLALASLGLVGALVVSLLDPGDARVRSGGAVADAASGQDGIGPPPEEVAPLPEFGTRTVPPAGASMFSPAPLPEAVIVDAGRIAPDPASAWWLQETWRNAVLAQVPGLAAEYREQVRTFHLETGSGTKLLRRILERTPRGVDGLTPADFEGIHPIEAEQIASMVQELEKHQGHFGRNPFVNPDKDASASELLRGSPHLVPLDYHTLRWTGKAVADLDPGFAIEARSARLEAMLGLARIEAEMGHLEGAVATAALEAGVPPAQIRPQQACAVLLEEWRAYEEMRVATLEYFAGQVKESLLVRGLLGS